MKSVNLRYISLLLYLSTALTWVTNAQQPAFITNGLVAYYQLNGDVNDNTGRQPHATAQNITFTDGRHSGSQSAAVFNGASSQILLGPISPRFGLIGTSNTVSLWVRSEDLDGGPVFVDYCGIPGIGDDTVSCGITLNQGIPRVSRRAPGSVIESWETTHASLSPNITDLMWHHIVVTFDGGMVKDNVHIFIDGIMFTLSDKTGLVGDNTFKSNVSYYDQSQYFRLGTSGADPNNPAAYWSRGPGDFFKGSIDDLRIYDRTLSSAEIKALYDYERSPQSPSVRGARAAAQLVNGFIVGATVMDGGYGYTNAPTVTVSGGGGSGAKIKAILLDGVVVSLVITSPGSGYTSVPTITISSPPMPPRRATASSSIVNGFVVAATLTDGGAGYQTAPTVLLIDGGGTGATAEAVVSGGSVVGINITNPGKGYTTPPRVSIASPPFSPELAIRVKTVSVHMKVVLGRRYRLESSVDMVHWNTVGNAFVAQEEELVQDLDVDDVGRFFRIQQIP